MHGDFPAKNTVYTPCIYMVLANPKNTHTFTLDALTLPTFPVFPFYRVGSAFRATHDEVTIRYTTQTCDAFYQNHGRIEQQLCGHPIQALSNLEEESFVDTLLGCGP
jgi:hypothetical protein